MGLFKRNKVWWMSFTYQGQQVRRSTECTDRRLAEAVLAKVKVKIKPKIVHQHTYLSGQTFYGVIRPKDEVDMLEKQRAEAQAAIAAKLSAARAPTRRKATQKRVKRASVARKPVKKAVKKLKTRSTAKSVKTVKKTAKRKAKR